MSHRMSGAEHGLSGKAPTMTDRQETQLNVAPTLPALRSHAQECGGQSARDSATPSRAQFLSSIQLLCPWFQAGRGGLTATHPRPLFTVQVWRPLSLRVSLFRNEDPFLRSSYPQPTSCHVSQAKIIHVPLPGHFRARRCRPPCFLAQSWFSLRSWAYLSRSQWKVSVSTKSGFSWQGNERGGERAARQATQTHRTGRKTGFHSWMWKQKLGPTNP